MRILHVFDHSLPVQSGYAFRSYNILREQREFGWSTAQVTGIKQATELDGVESVRGFEFQRVSHSPPWWGRRAPLDTVAAVGALRRRIARLVREYSPDLIHAHSPFLCGLAALGHGKPVVYEMRTLWEDGSILAGRMRMGGATHRLSRAGESFVLRRADGVVAICAGLRGEIIGRGVPSDKVVIVPNGVDPDSLQRTESIDVRAARQRFGVSAQHVVAYIGSLFEWEGLPQLVEAAAKVRARGRDLAVLIVGAGPDEAAIRAAVVRTGMESYVVLAGQVPHAVVGEAYAAADLLVYPRLPMPLTNLVTPLKPLEVMALGRTCIASDVGGHRELIEHGKTGLLYRAGSSDALADIMLQAIDSPDLRRSIGVNGPEHVQAARTWRHSVGAYRALYQQLAPSAFSRVGRA